MTHSRGPRNPRRITANGKTLTIAEWAEELGCKKLTIYARLDRGMDPVLAVTTPVTGDGRLTPVHGMTRTPEHNVWHAMKSRCKDMDDPRYGGRGIRVCKRWLESFVAFYDDMGPRPSDQHSIDRIDNDGNYACGKCDDCIASGVTKCNCRWATLDVQGRNRHNIRYIEVDGERLALLDWAERTGLPAETIWRRIEKYHWDPKRAVTTPLHHNGTFKNPRNTPISANGKALTVAQWATELGLSTHTLRARLYKCKSEEDVRLALSLPLQRESTRRPRQ